jgi:hypothetical protein
MVFMPTQSSPLTRAFATIALLLTLLLAACSGDDPTATPTLRPGKTPLPTPEPTATPIAGNLVEFRMRAPEPPDGNPVRLLYLFAGDFQNFAQITMDRGGEVWKATLELPPRGLVHYVYDHFANGDPSDGFKGKREAHGEAVKIHSRLLLTTPSRTTVDDVVETWNDTRVSVDTGALTGTVVDARTGEPVIDADVTAGGVHIATDFEGRFIFRDIAAGTQRVTAHTTLGDYAPSDATAAVSAGGTADVRITMDSARAMDVTFDVSLPADTPPDADIRVAGNIFQLGAYRIHENMPRLVQDVDLVPLERVSPTRARGTVALHQGTHLSYYYTLSGAFWAREHDDQSQPAYREAVVSAERPTVVDRVEAWKSSDQHLVELRITTPPDTDEAGFLSVTMGPSFRATRLSRTEFVVYLNGWAGNVIDYRLNWGDTSQVRDGSAGLDQDGRRQVVIGDADSVVEVVVERWTGHRDVSVAAPGSTVDIAFVATLPEGTTEAEHVGVVVDHGRAQQRFDLTKVDGATIWAGTVRVTQGASVTYWIDASSADGVRRGPDRTLTAEYGGQVVNDWVVGWSDVPQPVTRHDYITGVYTPDLFSSSMQAHTTPTYERIAAHNGGWVALSSVWQYGQILPFPTIESRQVYAPSVRTPRPHIVEQARKAREAGLKTLLAPQFNMEMVPGFGEQLNQVRSDAWWGGWFDVAEELWLWNADVAAEIDADALLLPGFVFHVFSGPGRFESDASFEAFDTRLAGLVERVRAVYDGKILISGGVRESELPGTADLVGVTTYDTGKPGLPPSASVDEWHTAYGALFVDAVDPLWERWGVPVLFYTINISAPSGGDGDEIEQARQLEGIMRAIDDRPWIAGSFMWAYHMVAQPVAADGLRNRLGEAVMARVYGAFAGGD